MSEPRYPCTGQVAHAGFGAYLEKRLGLPRANLKAFAHSLSSTFSADRITLVNSGSSANLAAALALAEVSGERPHAITAGFTFPTTMSSLLAAGFDVTVADTEPGGFGLDPGAARRALRPSTRVLCVTHFLGFPAAIDALSEIAHEHGLFLLQDACEGMDLRAAGTPVHARGTLTTWSFYHPHHLSAYGGGAVLAPDVAWQRRLESITHWGRACTCHVDGLACPAPFGEDGLDHQFHYVRPGHNLEMSELNACFGRFQLESWAAQEEARKRRYTILFEALAGCRALEVRSPPEGSGSPFVFPVTVRSGDARELAMRLRARGVETRSLMGGAITGQPAFRNIANDGLERCNGVSRASFLLGVHQTLPEEDVRAVAAIVRKEAQ